MMIWIVHHLPGRARFFVMGLGRTSAMAEFIERQLGERKGVLSVRANPTTGRVLVRFTSGTNPRRIAEKLQDIAEQFLEDPDAARMETGRGQLFQSEEKHASPWHVIDGNKVADHFGVDPSRGLDASEAAVRLAAYGYNRLPGTETRSFAEVAKSQLMSAPVLLTAAAALVAIIAGRVIEGTIALCATAANAGAGVFFEGRAEKAIGKVHRNVELKARVFRNGQEMEIPFEHFVPGDIVILGAGSRVPADARIVECDFLRVDESAFTGESVPIHKSVATMNRETAPTSRRRNMVFRGTLVVEGAAKAVVVAVGRHTMLGRLLERLGVVIPPEALAAREIRSFTRRLGTISLTGFGAFGVLCVFRGPSLAKMASGALALIAGAFPAEATTAAMSAFAWRQHEISKNHILVRRLRALGNMATIQMVCFDKTGTLTRNRMAVSEIRAGGSKVRFDRQGKPLEEKDEREAAKPDARWLATLAALCSETHMEHSLEKSMEASSTEIALINLAESLGIDLSDLDQSYPLEKIWPRTEEKPYMLTRHGTVGGDDGLLAIKGSPMDVLEKCSWFLKDGVELSLEEDDRLRIESENSEMAGDGLRVLAAAYRMESPSKKETDPDHVDDFVWTGLAGFSDPIREGAENLIQKLHKAGIRTAVITGDQSLTAQHIGEQLNLSGNEPLRILDAADLKRIDGQGIRSVVTRAHVFARLSPEQKLHIIQACQSAGMGVAMVGDGFNDVLALKSADVGIAMGRDGVEHARRAADLVLEDDRLESVFDVVVNGRAFYDNIGTSLSFLTGGHCLNVCAEVLSQSEIIRGGLSPWNGVWSNLACLAMAVAPPREGILALPPNAPGEPILKEEDSMNAAESSFDAMLSAGATGAYGIARYGWRNPRAGNLFWKSAFVNYFLQVPSKQGGNFRLHDGHKSNQALHAILGAAIGWTFLGTLLPKPFAGLLDAAAIATAGAISLRQASKKEKTFLPEREPVER